MVVRWVGLGNWSLSCNVLGLVGMYRNTISNNFRQRFTLQCSPTDSVWVSVSAAITIVICMSHTAKKASDPNLASPLTPASSGGIGLGDESSSGLGQDSTIEEFATPKGNTPMIPERLPLKSDSLAAGVESLAADQNEVLIKLTNDLNKAIRQRDISAFQYVQYNL